MKIKNHFEDCPYHCNESGMILDVSLRKMVKCPHCSKIKEDLIRGGMVETEDDERLPLATVLGIQNDYLSTQFVYESVIPDGEQIYIDSESWEMQKGIAEELYLGLTIGNLPETSMCFGFGVKGRLEKFIYPILAKAYMAGLTVGRVLSCAEYNRLSISADGDFSDLFNSDLVVMLINEGCSKADLSSAKGLMQVRALKGKPTIYVSTWSVEACSNLLGYFDNDSYSLATPCFIKYKYDKKKDHSAYINRILGVTNGNIDDEDVGEEYKEPIRVSSSSNSSGSSGGVSMSMMDLMNQ